MFPAFAAIVFVEIAIPAAIRFLVDSHRDPAADSLNCPCSLMTLRSMLS
jgi:hypothetical protein